MIYTAYGRWPMLEYELDIAQRELDAGNKVVFLTCSGNKNICLANGGIKPKKKRYCVSCKSRVRAGIKWLDSGNGTLVCENLDKPSVDLDDSKLNSSDEHYSAAISTLTTETRDIFFDRELYKNEIKLLYQDSISALEQTAYLYEKYKPSTIYLFNGRVSHYRPPLRFYQAKKKVELFITEYPWVGTEKYLLIKNVYPHDVDEVSRQIYDLAIRKEISHDEKISIGKSLLNKRIDGVAVDITGSFFSNITDDDFPDHENDFLITLFTSSEDECGEIAEHKKNRLFNTELDCVKFLLKNINFSCTLILRMHPRLKNLNTKYLNEIRSLICQNSLVELIVIPPESSSNSYTLVKKSNIVITFGSTIGLEAAYLGKPVITLGSAAYKEFDLDFKPTIKNQIIKYVKKVYDGYEEISVSKLRNQSCLFAYGLSAYGIEPKYLKRNNYYENCMVRGGVNSPIQAVSIIRFLNYLSDIPVRTSHCLRYLLSTPGMTILVFNRPLNSIKRFFKFILD